jgi:D-alanyl-lipoteichoic acid acyltransferase DltB (MBOAT superfamily)
LATVASGLLRNAVGQSAERASALDLRWLGFSYIAFRLIHTLRDRQNGRLPAVSLQEYLVYALFFPAFTAGPIDRLERFLQDLRRPLEPAADDFLQGGQRLAVGLFKKFALADSLALIALNGTNALQTAAQAGCGYCSMRIAFKSISTSVGTPTLPSGWGGCWA